MEIQEKNKIILFKYPSKARPERFFKIISCIIDNISDNCKYKIICSFDKDDTSYYNKEFLSKLKKYLNKYPIEVYFNKPDGKVSAYNANISTENFDVLISVNDWTEFKTKNFDRNILKHYIGYAGIVYFPSINQLGEKKYFLKTVSYEYYKARKFLYNPIYINNFYKEADAFDNKIWVTDDIHPENLYKLVISKAEVELFSYYNADWYYYSPDLLLSHNLKSWKEDLKTFENQQKSQ